MREPREPTRDPKVAIANVLSPALDAVTVKQKVAALAARLANAEARLATRDEEQAADAELVGRLLAEVADRDRQVRDRDARIALLEEDVRGLRAELGAARGARGEGATLSAATRVRRELGWLLETATSAIEETRTATERATNRLEDSRTVFDRMRGDGQRGDGDAHASIVATLRQSAHLRDLVTRIERAIGRAADQVREADRRDTRELDVGVAGSAQDVAAMMLQLRAGIAPLLASEPRDTIAFRHRPTPSRPKAPKSR